MSTQMTMNRIGIASANGLYRPLTNCVKRRVSIGTGDQYKVIASSDADFENNTGNKTTITNLKSNVTVKKRRISSTLAPSTPTPFHTRSLPQTVRDFIEDKAALVNCANIHVCDGSEVELENIIKLMRDKSMIEPLESHENCWLVRTDPRDVARVESKTVIATRNKHDTVPRAAAHAKPGTLGNWMSIDELDKELGSRLTNCMSGRTMYVIPFSMGPVGSALSKVGVQLTDSPYVVASMRIMTRVSRQIFDLINSGEDFVRCIHSVGAPLSSSPSLATDNEPIERNAWPCDPERTLIAHIPERKEIASYGSGYGGNSLLGKKCFALRMGSIMGRNEGWLAEHMLIVGVTNPQGVKKYIAGAFPSACGKTNLAMMTPALAGYKIECVGDDIAWMRFDENGVLRAINPEAGFFGVAPGTNERSNPIAMQTIDKNTIFTNTARTDDGSYYWEGLEHKLTPQTQVTSWLNEPWTPGCGKPAAHPNSRFCTPAAQCPIIDPEWESAEGVPISAIIFGGRRPEGVPLVYEAFNWQHGVFVGAAMRSESTAAAEHASKTIMHDPFAMRPFFGYNFGHYLDHWLSFGKHEPKLRLPKVFHVNWFRKDPVSGKFMWPGFGENARVLDWICKRCDAPDGDQRLARPTPIGLVPANDALNMDGMPDTTRNSIDLGQLLSVPRDSWLKEQAQIDEYLKTNVGQDLPPQIQYECNELKRRLLESS